MFTGIITDRGFIKSIEGSTDRRIDIRCAYELGSVGIGSSIACAGVCLTVVGKGVDWFSVFVSEATLSCTTLEYWDLGSYVNLEQSLRAGDEIGGHFVSGHVDGVGRIVSVCSSGESRTMIISVPSTLTCYIARKGSIAVDGVSLTVNEVSDSECMVNIIPHTLLKTSLGAAESGDAVNLEVDLLAKYAERLLRHE